MPYESPNIVIVPTNTITKKHINIAHEKLQSDKIAPISNIQTRSDVVEPKPSIILPVGDFNQSVSQSINMTENNVKRSLQDEKNKSNKTISKPSEVSQSGNTTVWEGTAKQSASAFDVQQNVGHCAKPIKLNLFSPRNKILNKQESTPETKCDQQMINRHDSKIKISTENKTLPQLSTPSATLFSGIKTTTVTNTRQTNAAKTSTFFQPTENINQNVTKCTQNKSESNLTSPTPLMTVTVTKPTPMPHQHHSNVITSNNKINVMAQNREASCQRMIAPHSAPNASSGFIPHNTWLNYPAPYPNTNDCLNATNNTYFNIQSADGSHIIHSSNFAPNTTFTPCMDTIKWFTQLSHTEPNVVANNIQQNFSYPMQNANYNPTTAIQFQPALDATCYSQISYPNAVFQSHEYFNKRSNCLHCESGTHKNSIGFRPLPQDDATKNNSYYNNFIYSSQLSSEKTTSSPLNNTCVCPVHIKNQTAYFDKDIWTRECLRFQKQIVPNTQSSNNNTKKSFKVSDNRAAIDKTMKSTSLSSITNVKEKTKKSTSLSSITKAKELVNIKKDAGLEKSKSENNTEKSNKVIKIKKALCKLETQIKKLNSKKKCNKAEFPPSEKHTFDLTQSSKKLKFDNRRELPIESDSPKKVEKYDYNKNMRSITDNRDKKEKPTHKTVGNSLDHGRKKRVYDDSDDVYSKTVRLKISEQQNNKKQSFYQKSESEPRFHSQNIKPSQNGERAHKKRERRNSSQSHEFPPRKRIRENSDNGINVSPIKSYAQRNDLQVKHPRVQAPENNSSKYEQDTDFDFDLRSKLNRMNHNHYPQTNESNDDIQNEGLIEKENLVITVSQNNSDSSNAKLLSPLPLNPKSKPKKTKTIKLVINVTCGNQDDSSDDASDNSHSGDVRNIDLSFLDDFNIEEIVNSLKHSPKRENTQQSSRRPIKANEEETEKKSVKSLIKDFVQPVVIKKEIKSEYLETVEQPDVTHKKSECEESQKKDEENMYGDKALPKSVETLHTFTKYKAIKINTEVENITLIQDIKQENDVEKEHDNQNESKCEYHESPTIDGNGNIHPHQVEATKYMKQDSSTQDSCVKINPAIDNREYRIFNYNRESKTVSLQKHDLHKNGNLEESNNDPKALYHTPEEISKTVSLEKNDLKKGNLEESNNDPKTLYHRIEKNVKDKVKDDVNVKIKEEPIADQIQLNTLIDNKTGYTTKTKTLILSAEDTVKNKTPVKRAENPTKLKTSVKIDKNITEYKSLVKKVQDATKQKSVKIVEDTTTHKKSVKTSKDTTTQKKTIKTNMSSVKRAGGSTKHKITVVRAEGTAERKTSVETAEHRDSVKTAEGTLKRKTSNNTAEQKTSVKTIDDTAKLKTSVKTAKGTAERNTSVNIAGHMTPVKTVKDTAQLKISVKTAQGTAERTTLHNTTEHKTSVKKARDPTKLKTTVERAEVTGERKTSVNTDERKKTVNTAEDTAKLKTAEITAERKTSVNTDEHKTSIKTAEDTAKRIKSVNIAEHKTSANTAEHKKTVKTTENTAKHNTSVRTVDCTGKRITSVKTTEDIANLKTSVKTAEGAVERKTSGNTAEHKISVNTARDTTKRIQPVNTAEDKTSVNTAEHKTSVKTGTAASTAKRIPSVNTAEQNTSVKTAERTAGHITSVNTAKYKKSDKAAEGTAECKNTLDTAELKKSIKTAEDNVEDTAECNTSVNTAEQKTSVKTAERTSEHITSVNTAEYKKSVKTAEGTAECKNSLDTAELKKSIKTAESNVERKTSVNTAEYKTLVKTAEDTAERNTSVNTAEHKITIITAEGTGEHKTSVKRAEDSTERKTSVDIADNSTMNTNKLKPFVPTINTENKKQHNNSNTKQKKVNKIGLSKPNEVLAEKIVAMLSDYLHQELGVLSLIRHGRYSNIFNIQNKSGQNYAVKVLRDGSSYNFKQKQKIIGHFQTDVPKENLNTVYFMSYFNIDMKWCILMEHYPRNLMHALEERVFHLDEIQKLGKQLVSAVLMLSSKNIVHSDIQPKHILLDESNSKLKLCGFDAAYYTDFVNLLPNIGTVSYRAPEIILGYAAGVTIDVWSTALVLYEMATGVRLFQGIYNNEVLFKQMCFFGNIPLHVVYKSIFGYKHFLGGTFLRRVGFKGQNTIHIEKFNKTGNLHSLLLGNYYRRWGSSRTQSQKEHDIAKLNSFHRMLEQMLNLDPKQRLTIECAYLHPFLRMLN